MALKIDKSLLHKGTSQAYTMSDSASSLEKSVVAVGGFVQTVHNLPDAISKLAAHGKKQIKLVQQTEVQMLADELIQLDNKLKSIDTSEIVKRMTAIKKELLATLEDVPDDEPYTFDGSLGEVEFSAKSVMTEIVDQHGLYTKLQSMGDEVVAGIVKFGLGDLKKVLGENEIKAFSQEKSGPRTCKIKPSKETTSD